MSVIVFMDNNNSNNGGSPNQGIVKRGLNELIPLDREHEFALVFALSMLLTAIIMVYISYWRVRRRWSKAKRFNTPDEESVAVLKSKW